MTGAGPYMGATGVSKRTKVGSLGIIKEVRPGEEETFEFIMTWYFPNRANFWVDAKDFSKIMTPDESKMLKTILTGSEEVKEGLEDLTKGLVLRNYYATLFKDAWHVGEYLSENMGRLEGHSRDFHRALFGTTLPGYVLDAISSNITVIRSTTCFRIEDGTLLGHEGCYENMGCCPGSCTHVWNYAQTMAFLFPDLEKSMRRVEFNLETNDDGKMAFRAMRVFIGDIDLGAEPAVDGQMGTIIRLYREWKLTGDDVFLKEVWEKAKRALDFAFDYWDSDGDFVLDSKQHNTYDIEFYGPNSLSNSMFFAALKAGIEISEYLGDREHSERYKEALDHGVKRMDELLWNGEYYIQDIDDVNSHRYQFGRGCLADQLLGQSLAHVVGLGYILPEEHVKSSVKSIFDYNYLTDFRHHQNVQRTYVLNDEKGLVLCSWPHGGRPKLPFIYADEVWTGIEYQVASHLIYEGFIDEGLVIVKSLRDRHDGYRRNPFNEVECGNHYVRSMASWGLLTALSGFTFDMTKGEIGFDPVVIGDTSTMQDFSCFWSTGTAWGIYRQKDIADVKTRKRKNVSREIEVLYGDEKSVSLKTR